MSDTRFALTALTAITFPRTTVGRETVTRARAESLLAKYGDRITVARGTHSDPEAGGARYVAEEFNADGEPWTWTYRGDSREELESAVVTWLLVTDDEDQRYTLRITLP